MCDDIPMSFRAYYEQFHAGKQALSSTPQEARAILMAFIDYRKFLNLPTRPVDTKRGVTLIYKMLYHKRMMERALEEEDRLCADQHWRAALEAWKLFLYAIYLDDACHPDHAPRIALHDRLRHWWHRGRIPLRAPDGLPREAWAMVWAVDSLRDEMIVSARRRNSISSHFSRESL